MGIGGMNDSTCQSCGMSVQRSKGHLCGIRPPPPASMNLGGSLRSVSSNGGAEATATCPKEVAGEKEILELDRADE